MTARELDRLGVRRVHLVGDVGDGPARAVERLGAVAEPVGAGSRYRTAMAVARRAVQLGANPSTVIVASGRTPVDSLAAGALAAGKRRPVVFARRWTGKARLARRLEELGARRTVVVAPRRQISARMVRGLPNVRRVTGPTRTASAAAVATRARRAGLTGRPVLVGGRRWGDAPAAGVVAGHRREAPVLVTTGRELARPAARWLARVEPRGVMLVGRRGRMPDMTRCQVRSGGLRRWRCAERALHRQGYVVPHVDGRIDRFSVWAVYAFEKIARRRPNGLFGEGEWQALLRRPRMRVRRPDLPPTHVEITSPGS